jgi:hypothetical protein
MHGVDHLVVKVHLVSTKAQTVYNYGMLQTKLGRGGGLEKYWAWEGGALKI